MEKTIHWRYSKLFVLACIFSIIVVGLELSAVYLVTGEGQKTVISDLSSPIIDAVVFTALFIAAKQSAAHSKRLAIALGLICLAMFFNVLGDVSWGIIELGLKQAPFPSIADLFYLIYYPLILAGVLCLPRNRADRRENLRRTLDISIILLASTLGLWYFLIGPLVQSNLGEPLFNQIILLAYSVGDVVLLGALLDIIFSRYGENIDLKLIYLSASLVIAIISDCIYSYQTLQGTYVSGGLLDIGWIIGSLLIGLTAILFIVSNKRKEDPAQFSQSKVLIRKLQTFLPFLSYILLVGVYILLVLARPNPKAMSFQTMSIFVGGVIGLVLIRQVITLSENIRLNTQLSKTNNELQIEIGKRDKVEEQLFYDNLHDELTGLANRTLFKDRLDQMIAYARRYAIYSCAILFIDLDRFKVINDSLGHLIGDQILVQVAQRLSDCLRSGDTVARFGGDEFEVLLNKTDDTSSVLIAVNKIIEALHAPFELEGHDLYITASIGIVPNLVGYQTAEEILQDADIAMYAAKSLGKDRFEIFNVNMRVEANSRLLVENDIRRGLENQEFQLYYQPIVDLKTDHLMGFEALIRWLHNERGLLQPGEFLDIAEESGLIVPIGDWVLKKACRQLKSWQQKYPELQGLSVSVNISSRQFSQPNFDKQVVEALNASGLKAEDLKLEITEKVLINNFSAARRVFSVLQELGVQIQLDDFGTGYSAMAYLQHFPIDALKIDRSFIHEIDKDYKSSELVRAIVAMAHALGIHIIAEGIETDHELYELKGLFCDYGQGFLISRPMDSVSAGKVLTSMGDGIQYPDQNVEKKTKK
jgi:diguanylate cyclase (GGDEF)-like protein